MSITASLLGRRPRPAARRPMATRRPGLEPLEGRALMALLSSVTFDPKGQEIADVIIHPPGSTYGVFHDIDTPGYMQDGPTPYLYHGEIVPQPTSTEPGQLLPPIVQAIGPIRSISTAYDPAGDVVQDAVDVYGNAVQYDSFANGTYSKVDLGSHVESVSVAFEPDGTGVSDVVYEDGDYYEFTTKGGSTLVATNVVSASVAIDKSGDKLQDYVTADGVLHEISGSGTTTLGDQVVSGGVAFDGGGNVVRSVVYTNGTAVQFDSSGEHVGGTIFTPVTSPPYGSTSVAFDPTGQEYAPIAYDDGSLEQFTSSGAPKLLDEEVLSASTAFSPDGKVIYDVVYEDGDAYEYIGGYPARAEGQESIEGSAGTFLGSGVQSVSIAFDAQGHEVADVVYKNGDYYEFTASGQSTLVATDVISASVAIDGIGDKYQDYVTADGVAREITTYAIHPGNGSLPGPTPPTVTVLGTNAVGIGVAIDQADGLGDASVVRSVLFNDGQAYQYDATGQHLQGQVFYSSLYNSSRLALTQKIPAF